MSEGGQAGGGAKGGTGGAGSEDPKPDDNYSAEFVQRLMDEKKQKSRELQELKEWKLSKEAQEKDAEETLLKEQGKYKEALEAKEKELEEERLVAQLHKQQIEDGVKLSTFLDELDGGVEREYWPLINLDEIKLDDAGQPDPESVKQSVDTFREKYPRIIVSADGPELPNHPPKPPGTSIISYDDWLKLPTKEMQARQKDVDPKTVPEGLKY
jgi:hypothetical protein